MQGENFFICLTISTHHMAPLRHLRTGGVLLQSRGCPLKGLPGTPDLEAQRRRFTKNGWQRAEAADMDTIHRCHIDPVDRQRCAALQTDTTYGLLLVSVPSGCSPLRLPIWIPFTAATSSQWILSWPNQGSRAGSHIVHGLLLPQSRRHRQTLLLYLLSQSFATSAVLTMGRAERLEIFDEFEEWHLIQVTIMQC